MNVQSRRVDAKSRVTLPEGFASREVTIENLSDDRVVIQLVKQQRPVFSLSELLAGLTEDQLHPEVDFGPLRGEEVL